jgi:phage tail sheath gpL-like
MTISFNSIPADIRVPGAYIEVDNSRATNNLQQQTRVLVIGQRTDDGETDAGVLTRVTTAAQATLAFGVGSILDNMFQALFRNDSYTEKWAIALDDNGTDYATGQVVVTGPAEESGTLHLYFGGVHITVGVATDDSATDIGDAIEAAVTARPDLPITANNVTGTVTFTYKNAGTVGNAYDLRVNYRGKLGGETLPAGVTLSFTQVSGGSGDPDIDDALSLLPDEIFDYVLVPYTDSGNLDALDAEMQSRWDPLRMLEGHVFTAYKGNTSDVATFGETRNGQHMTVMDAANNSPTPPMLWAAATCGRVAKAASIDPARPFNSLPLTGVLAEPVEYRRTIEENNSLLFAGITTHSCSRTGNVTIQRVVTSYQLNSFDVPDASYLDANTLFTISYFRKTLRERISSRFPRHKLAENNTNFGAGQAIATPKIVKAEIVALAKEWEALGLLEDIDQFKDELIVERDTADRNRINAMLPTNLVNQFHVFAAQISFII